MQREGKGTSGGLRNLLGLPLEEAEELLARDGFVVETVETRSRKGVDGRELRVVRVREIPADSPTVQLTYSRFKTCAEDE